MKILFGGRSWLWTSPRPFLVFLVGPGSLFLSGPIKTHHTEHRWTPVCISPSLQRPLTVLREPHEFGWVAGQADPPGIAGAHSELVLAAWGQVLNDEVRVQSRGYRLLPDLRACRTEGERGSWGKHSLCELRAEAFSAQLRWYPGRVTSTGFLRGSVTADC